MLCSLKLFRALMKFPVPCALRFAICNLMLTKSIHQRLYAFTPCLASKKFQHGLVLDFLELACIGGLYHCTLLLLLFCHPALLIYIA